MFFSIQFRSKYPKKILLIKKLYYGKYFFDIDFIDFERNQQKVKRKLNKNVELSFFRILFRLPLTFCGHILWRKSEPRTLR
jgi:hypothetical protein